jgi:hypothetical protein
LYEIQQQQQQINFKLLQTFPEEHPSHCYITSLIQINPNTLVSASAYTNLYYSKVIVIWSKSSSLYEPVQRIKREEAGGYGINSLVLIKQKKEEEEEVFASCSGFDGSIIIWRRGKGGDEFKIKQKIENVMGVWTLLYIPQTNELISGSESLFSSHLKIWSPSSSSSSSSSDFVEIQKIQTSSSGIVSLCQINRNDTKSRIKFASGHGNGKIKIWSKQINESNHYSLLKTLQRFNYHYISDLIFINDKGFDCLISCSQSENKIKIFKGDGKEDLERFWKSSLSENKIVIYKEGKDEEEELEHKGVHRLISMSNGRFASGGENECLNIWSLSSYSSFSS